MKSIVTLDANETGCRLYSTLDFSVMVLTPQLLNEEQKCVWWDTTLMLSSIVSIKCENQFQMITSKA